MDKKEILSYFETKLKEEIAKKKSLLNNFCSADIYALDASNIPPASQELITEASIGSPPIFVAFTAVILLEIDSEDLAREIHSEILSLIEKYKVKEMSWAQSLNKTSTYAFRFSF